MPESKRLNVAAMKFIQVCNILDGQYFRNLIQYPVSIGPSTHSLRFAVAFTPFTHRKSHVLALPDSRRYTDDAVKIWPASEREHIPFADLAEIVIE